MNNKRLMKVFGLLLVIGLLAVISPLTRAQARTTDTFSISDWNIDGLAVDDSGRPVISPQSGTPTIDPIPAQITNEHVELTFVVHAEPGFFGLITNLVYSLVPAPSGATLTKTNNEHATFRWTPEEAQGPHVYNFTVLVCETAGLFPGCATRPVQVTVNEVNVAPVLAPIGDKTIAELALLSFNATATDADIPVQALGFSLADGDEGEVPEGAEITPAGAFSWTPSEAQGPGEYTFDVCVSDGALSDCETITVTVTEVNVAPVLAEIGDQEIDELDTLEFVATATDADIPVQTLVFSLAGEVPEGAVITPAGAFSWTPTEAQGPGEYTFDVCVSDGVLSDCETITVTVSEVNVAPVAEDISAETPEDTAVAITLLASDVDGDKLTFTVTQPAHGTLSGTAPALTYTPEPNYNGTDSFTYKASDGKLESDPATVTITVGAVNDEPKAVDDKYDAWMGQVLEVPAELGVLANDIDPDPSDEQTVELKDAPLHGVLVLNPDGSFTYEPAAGFYGVDTFTYWLLSQPGTTAVGPYLDWATVTITVRPVARIFLPIILK